MTKTPLIELLPDPDNIGQSGYRALYDLIDSALETYEYADAKEETEAAIAILTEAKGWAESLIKQIKTYQKTGRMP